VISPNAPEDPWERAKVAAALRKVAGEAAARRIIAFELRKKLGRFYVLWGASPWRPARHW